MRKLGMAGKKVFGVFICIILILLMISISSSVDGEKGYVSYRKLTSSLWNSELSPITEIETNNNSYVNFSLFYTISNNVVSEIDPTSIINNPQKQYIVIESADDLFAFSIACNGIYQQNYLTYHYLLGNDIDYSDASSKYRFVKPIGWGEKKFEGSFDGQGYVISNLFYQRIESDEIYQSNYTMSKNGMSYELVYYSLFSEIGTNGIVCNVGLIDPIMLQASMFGPMLFASSLVGKNNGTVSNVYMQDLRGDSSGLSAEGGFHVSSLLSYNNGTFKNAYVAANLIISTSVSFSSQSIRFPVMESASETSITNNIFYDSSVLSGTYTNNDSLVTPLLTNQFLTSSFAYETEGVSNGWYSSYTYEVPYSNFIYGKYPILKGFTTETDVSGTNFIIDSTAKFAYFLNLIAYAGPFRSAKYVLTKTIDMNSISKAAYISSGAVFSGTLRSSEKSDDGYRFKMENGTYSSYNAILNFKVEKGVSYNGYRCYGLFSILSGNVENINILNALVMPLDLLNDTSYLETNALGIVCGKQEGGSIRNVSVSGEVVLSAYEDKTSVNSMAKSYVGGLVGYSTGGVIRWCISSGLIDGNYHKSISNISETSIGGSIGFLDGATEISNVYNAAAVKAIRFDSDNNSNVKQYVGGMIGLSKANDCFMLENDGNVIIGELGKDYYYNTIYASGIVGLYLNSTNNNGIFINNSEITFYARHLNQATNAYISGLLNVKSNNKLYFTNLAMRGNLNIINDVKGTVTASSPTTSLTTSTMNLRVSGGIYSQNTNLDILGLYNFDSYYQVVNNQKVLVDRDAQQIDLSIISEYAPCMVSENESTYVTLKRSYNYRNINYITTQSVKFYNLKLSGNCSGKKFILDNVRNDGNILINFTNNADTMLNTYYNQSNGIDYKKLKVYGIFEENSANCTAKNLYNGGNIEVTMASGVNVYFNIYLAGICYKNDGGKEYFTQNGLLSTDVMIDESVQGTLYNCVNNGNLTISGKESYNAGKFYGVTRLAGITSINASIISTCFNLGTIYNCNYIVSANSTGGSYAGEFEVESGGICFLMLGEYAQIKDSANNGKVFSINTSTSSSWVNASGIAARNEKDEFGVDLSNTNCANTNAHRQKIQYTINYGDIYSYNLQNDSYTTYEPRCKSGGFLSLGVCNIVNVVNYGNIYSTKVAGGMYGLVFIYKFRQAGDTDGNRVYIANAINYGKVQTTSIISNNVPNEGNLSSFSQVTYADGSHPNGALIGYIANSSSASESATSVLLKIKISYLINFDDELNIVGRSYHITSSSTDYATIRNTLMYMATTRESDSSPVPFNKDTTNNFGIKAYYKDLREPDYTATDVFSRDYNGGIFNVNYGLRNTTNVDESIITNKYIADYIQFIPYSKVNDYLVEKIGLSGTIFANAYQTFVNQFEAIYAILEKGFDVKPSSQQTIYDDIKTKYGAYIDNYNEALKQYVLDYYEETSDYYGLLAYMLNQTKGNITDTSLLEDSDVFASLLFNDENLAVNINSENVSCIKEVLLTINNMGDSTTINNIYNSIGTDQTLINNLSTDAKQYIKQSLLDGHNDNTFVNSLYSSLLSKYQTSEERVNVFNQIAPLFTDDELKQIISSSGNIQTDLQSLNSIFEKNPDINTAFTTMSNSSKLISLATSSVKSASYNNYGVISGTGTYYAGTYIDINGASIPGTYSRIKITSGSGRYSSSGTLSSGNLSFSYSICGGSYSISSDSSSYLYGSLSGSIGSYGSKLSNVTYAKYINYPYTGTNTTNITNLKTSLNSLSSSELQIFWNKYLQNQGIVQNDRNLYLLIIETKIYNDASFFETVLNQKNTNDQKLEVMKVGDLITYDEVYNTINPNFTSDDKANIVTGIASYHFNDLSSNQKALINDSILSGVNAYKNQFTEEQKTSISPIIDKSSLNNKINNEELSFEEVRGLISFLAGENPSRFINGQQYFGVSMTSAVIAMLSQGHEDDVNGFISTLFNKQISSLDEFIEFMEYLDLSYTDYTDFTGIYALSSSLGIDNGEFIPDNIRLIDLDTYLENDDNGNPINDPVWRGGTVENPNSYLDNGNLNTSCVNYKIYQEMKQLKKSIATNVFKIELVDSDDSNNVQNIIKNNPQTDYDLINNQIDFYIAINADELHANYLTINTSLHTYELSNLASFYSINKLYLDINSISVGDCLTFSFVVQAEDKTVKSEYTVRVFITQAKSVTTLSSVKVNNISTTNYTGNVNELTINTNVNAVDGSLQLGYNLVNVPNMIDLTNNIKVYRADSNEEVFDYTFSSMENNAIVTNSSFDIITNSWSTGSLIYEINFDSKLRSGNYYVLLELTEDLKYKVNFTKAMSTECEISSISYQGVVYEGLENQDSVTTYVKYGTLLDKQYFLDISDNKPSYLDDLLISDLASFTISNVSVSERNGIKTYSVIYQITAENSAYYTTFTHYLVEYEPDTEISNAYLNGRAIALDYSNSIYSLSFKKSMTPDIRIQFDFTKTFFTSDSQYLVVEYTGNNTEVDKYFSISIDTTQSIDIVFNQAAPSKEYTFIVKYQNLVGINFTETVKNVWDCNLTTISITKDKNERSYLENITFISESLLTSIDTIVTTDETTSENYLDRRNDVNKEVVCLPNKIYYGNYEYTDIANKQPLFYVVGLVSKTNLLSYSPTFIIPEDSSIYRVVEVDSVIYRIVPYVYLQNDEEKEKLFLVNENNDSFKLLDGTDIIVTGSYLEFTYDSITYTISQASGKLSYLDGESNVENSSLKADFNPQVNDGVAEFNYIRYRIYSEKYVDEQSSNYYTDYYIAIQDITNNVKLNVQVTQDQGINLSSYLYTYIQFVNYQLPDNFTNPEPTLADYSVLDYRLGFFAYYVSNSSELIEPTLKTSKSGRYDITVSLPKGYSFEVSYKDGSDYFDYVGTSSGTVSIIITGSIISKVVDVNIKIIQIDEQSQWGQNTNFGL